MSTFTEYLTESTKSYDFKIKVAGDLEKDFANRMEGALKKFDIQKMSAGKSTPIQSLPLDFPNLKNEAVTIYDVTTAYPASAREMKEYLADYMNINPTMMVVRKPNEPSEEYQEQMEVDKNSEYKNKLLDIEMSDSPEVKSEDYHSSEANMSLLKELMKNKEEIEYAEKPKVEQEIQSKEEKPTPSPFTKTTNPHPDPARK